MFETERALAESVDAAAMVHDGSYVRQCLHGGMYRARWRESGSKLQCRRCLQDLLRLRGPEVVVPLPPVAAEVAAQVPSLPWLREHFRGLHPRHRQCGLDDRRSATFARDVAAEARATVARGEMPAALTALRRGAPRCCRAALWSTALCVAPDDQRCATADACGPCIGRMLVSVD